MRSNKYIRDEVTLFLNSEGIYEKFNLYDSVRLDGTSYTTTRNISKFLDYYATINENHGFIEQIIKIGNKLFFKLRLIIFIFSPFCSHAAFNNDHLSLESEISYYSLSDQYVLVEPL